MADEDDTDETEDTDEELTEEQYQAKIAASDRIKTLLEKAGELVAECEKIADEHGICFHQPTDGYGTYTGADRSGTEEQEYDLAYPQDWDGWQASAIC